MLLLGDSAESLKSFNDNCIDLTVTSPPYDNLRQYNGNSIFDFKSIAQELYRVTKEGGVVVWIVGDATIDGSETGTSFRQALYFMEIGFRLHDTMIYEKNGFTNPSSNRYHQTLEYMFVFSKGRPKTFNPIKDRQNKRFGEKRESTKRQKQGNTEKYICYFDKEYGTRYNIWRYNTGYMMSTTDKVAYQHSAIFPEQLVADHIKSWSNECDYILDPFLGSGTTYKMAILLNRKPIGIEINPEYIEIAKKRLLPYLSQTKLLTIAN